MVTLKYILHIPKWTVFPSLPWVLTMQHAQSVPHTPFFFSQELQDSRHRPWPWAHNGCVLHTGERQKKNEHNCNKCLWLNLTNKECCSYVFHVFFPYFYQMSPKIIYKKNYTHLSLYIFLSLFPPRINLAKLTFSNFILFITNLQTLSVSLVISWNSLSFVQEISEMFNLK